jgi:formamidopyrimidine-DNA glycosylase
MPELPEVEAVCRKLRASVVCARIRSVTVWRCATPEVAELSSGRKITGVERRAKHILIRLSGGNTLHVHLRMTGNLFAIPDARLHSATARAVFHLQGGAGIVYEDPRALGRIEVARTADLDASLADLGPEPLGAEFTPDAFVTLARQSQQPAKLFLMDQRRIAGLGNIYAAEALFRAGVDPRKPLARMVSSRLVRLHGEIVAILETAVESAVRAYGGPGEFAEAEDFPLAVYDREGEPCLRCGQGVRRIAQGGRSTYFCARCQR